jgi:hypothetical protein
MIEVLAGAFHAPSAANAHTVRAIRTAFTMLLLLVAVVAWRSLYSPNPITLLDVTVTVNADDPQSAVQLTEVRTWQGAAEETVGVVRHITPVSDDLRRVALEGGLFSATQGRFETSHTILLPQNLQGQWCLHTLYTWWPSWSQREFSMESPDVCFDVPSNPQTRLSNRTTSFQQTQPSVRSAK